jgi:hypothetical protein
MVSSESVAFRRHIVRANCNGITASISIHIFASPRFAADLSTLVLIDEELWASEGVALALLTTTLVHIGVCAINIIAQDVCSVEAVQVVVGTPHERAPPFLFATCVLVDVMHACGILARYV